MVKLIMIAVLAVLCAYAVAVLAPSVEPLLRTLAARYGFTGRRPVDVPEEGGACPHGESMTDATDAKCPLCTPERALEAEHPALTARVEPPAGPPGRTVDAPADRVLIENATWLMARWAEAERERDHGVSMRFPSWHFDAPTDQQRERLRDTGLTVRLADLTRGQAADILGLFEPPEPADRETLRFFDVPSEGLNRSRARHEVAQLLAAPKNLQAWNERPADLLQKEFFRCFGLTMPSGLTALDAEALIRDHRGKLDEDGSSSLLEEWDAFESICVELLNPDAGDAYDIRTPSLAAIRSGVDALRREGRPLSELAADPQLIADKLVELDPELRLRGE